MFQHHTVGGIKPAGLKIFARSFQPIQSAPSGPLHTNQRWVQALGRGVAQAVACMRFVGSLKSMPNVILKNRSQVFGYYDHNMLVMSERISDHLPKTEKYSPKQRLWYIRAKEVIISSGSIERPLVFGNNDTPGVMLSSAAKEYLKVYGVLVGKKPIIFTNNDSGYETAIEFKKNGVDPIVLDTRKDTNSEIIKEAKELNINIKFSYVVVAAQGYKKVK